MNLSNSSQPAFKILPTKLKAALALACVVSLSPVMSADAKIGDSIAAYRAKNANKYRFKSQDTRGAMTYYRFGYTVSPEEEAANSGFGVGITITVSGGKIVGQSMAIRMGSNYEEGRKMAARKALEFILEGIGKAKSTSPTEDAQQISSIRNALEQALVYSPQNIQFPGFPQRSKLSVSSEGDLLVAILPPPDAPPGSFLQGQPGR